MMIGIIYLEYEVDATELKSDGRRRFLSLTNRTVITNIILIKLFISYMKITMIGTVQLLINLYIANRGWWKPGNKV